MIRSAELYADRRGVPTPTGVLKRRSWAEIVAVGAQIAASRCHNAAAAVSPVRIRTACPLAPHLVESYWRCGGIITLALDRSLQQSRNLVGQARSGDRLAQ